VKSVVDALTAHRSAALPPLEKGRSAREASRVGISRTVERKRGAPPPPPPRVRRELGCEVVRGTSHRARRVVALGAVLALGAVAAPGAGAIVPPKNCGMLTVKAKRYQIKADQMRCSAARTYATRYLRSHTRPSGFQCTDYGSSTALKFRCAKRTRVFFAIKR
jgi:hypothetical protein